jgi:hypothetical protein
MPKLTVITDTDRFEALTLGRRLLGLGFMQGPLSPREDELMLLLERDWFAERGTRMGRGAWLPTSELRKWVESESH